MDKNQRKARHTLCTVTQNDSQAGSELTEEGRKATLKRHGDGEVASLLSALHLTVSIKSHLTSRDV